MAFVTLGAGAFLTFRTGFFQFTHLKKALLSPFKRSRAGQGVTPFQAMATALGGSIGTANIAGTAGAIMIGGPGAVFWMWVSGLTGMAAKLTEIILAVKYRDNSTFPPSGGAMYYIELGLGKRARPLALWFSVFGCLAALIGTALVQPNTIAVSVCGAASSFGLRSGAGTKLLIGSVSAAMTGAVIFGGAKRIGRFSERAVPLMAGLFTLVSIALIAARFRRIPQALAGIFEGAFGIRPAAGGLCCGALCAFKTGTARGVYSNEAGVGSASIAHAGSSETDPVRQGLLGIFEVFADTLVTCSMTALVILTSRVSFTGAGSGMELALSAFADTLGQKAASLFLSVCILLFAFTSLIGWSLYGERCCVYVFGKRSVKLYRAAFLLLIPVGAAIDAGAAWRAGECFNYLMALPNLIALLLLSGKAAREVRDYKMFEKTARRGYNKG